MYILMQVKKKTAARLNLRRNTKESSDDDESGTSSDVKKTLFDEAFKRMKKNRELSGKRRKFCM